jgi:hypothetical protein
MFLEGVQRLDQAAQDFLHLAVHTVCQVFNAVLDTSEGHFKRGEVVVSLNLFVVRTGFDDQSLGAFL